MIQTYSVLGMTCNGCRNSVEQKLKNTKGVVNAIVDLVSETATVESLQPLAASALQNALPEKFTILEIKADSVHTSKTSTKVAPVNELSKLKQLKPLLLIFGCIVLLVSAKHYDTLQLDEMMLDFMGTFFLIFSLFKFFDLKGFATSFAMYDPLAKLLPVYGKMFPFLEIVLGVLFLSRLYIPVALIGTLIILGITTIGVIQTLISKKEIQCACLGTVLKLPMTEATFIENAVMIGMAFTLIYNYNI